MNDFASRQWQRYPNKRSAEVVFEKIQAVMLE